VAAKQIVPQLGLDSYSCPHCGAISQQTWFKGFLVSMNRDQKLAVEKYDPTFHLAIKNAKNKKARGGERT